LSIIIIYYSGDDMKRWLLMVSLLIFAAALAAANTQPATAQAANSNLNASILCTPDIYLSDPVDCLPLGPSSYLTSMASMGITFPARPLLASKPDPSLTLMPYDYAVLHDSADLYSTLDEARAGAAPARTLGGEGIKFISYVDLAYAEGKEKPSFYQLKSGEWTPDVASRWSGVLTYQGLEFAYTPYQTFGWINAINSVIETKRTPGYQNDYTGKFRYQYEVVQIYDVQEVSGMEWYLVGADEWIDGRFIGRVYPNSTPPDGVTNGRWIEINLHEQTLAVYDQNQLVYATLIASGLPPFWTRPGLFPIYKMHESTPMSGTFEVDGSDFYYLEDVPWTLYYDEARAIHGAYWRPRLGFPQSHGCVNLAPGDAHWVFNWANEGDWVYVWDPSGETPVDPELYSPGGA
jgi:lipoprotein-anchoring transpeptidase ErfK/SrfK